LLPIIIITPVVAYQQAVTRPQIPPAPITPVTLAQVLEKSSWNAAERGPLIFLKEIRTSKPKTPLPQNPSLRNDAGAFDLRLVTVGTITTLAPATMRVPNPLPQPDGFTHISAENAFKALKASLSESQWRLLCSKNGLGLNDLSDRTQKALFRASLPYPFRVITRSDKSIVTQLSDQERDQVRLNIFLDASYYLQLPTNKQDENGKQQWSYPAMWREAWWNTTPLQVASTDRSATSLSWQNNPNFFFSTVPARLKTSQINFESPALQKNIPLDNIKTLGDLVARVATATGLDLRADIRLANSPLEIQQAQGDVVRAGDILKALAWCTTGAWRKVGSCFLLTDDIVGIGARNATIDEWIQAEQEAEKRFVPDITKRETQSFEPLSFYEGDVFALPEKTKKAFIDWKVIERKGAEFEFKDFEFNFTEISAAGQEKLREQASKPKSEYVIGGKLRLTNVLQYLYFQVPSYGVLPSTNSMMVGTLPQNASDVDPQVPPPKPSNTVPANTSLMVAPQTESEAKQLATMAYERGFSSLWIQGDKKILEAAQSEIKNFSKMQIVWQPDFFRAETKEQVDLTVHGEPQSQQLKRILPKYYPVLLGRGSDQLDIAQPDAQSILQKRLQDAGNIPHLSGLAIRLPLINRDNDLYSTLIKNSLSGYTEKNRLAYLRTVGIDPIDLDLINSPWRYDPNLFSGNREVANIRRESFDALLESIQNRKKIWYSQNNQNLTTFMSTLYPNIQKLSFPIWIEKVWFYNSWDEASNFAIRDKKPEESWEIYGKQESKRGFYRWQLGQEFLESDNSQFLETFQFYYKAGRDPNNTKETSGFDSFLMDMSLLPTEKCVTLLEKLEIQKPKQ
jgi:hypothetical protein